MIEFINWFDQTIYEAIQILHCSDMTKFMIIVTNFTSAFVLIILCVILLYKLKNKKTGVYIIINLIFVFALNQILKFIINRDRPDINQLVEVSGYSFPSGHSMVSFGFYGFLIYLICKNIKNNKLKTVYSFFIGMIIFLIGSSRIYLGVHYATDVIGGFLIGLIYLVLYINFVYKKDIFKFDFMNRLDGQN